MRFSKQALRTLESAEDLDEAARLVPAPVWLAAAAAALVLAVGGCWAIFAVVPRTVSAQGVLTYSAGVSTLAAGKPGQVVTVWARSDQQVAQGQPLYTESDEAGSQHNVLAPWPALVVNQLISSGQWLRPETPVFALERLDSSKLEAAVYVDAVVAPSLRPGMAVRLEARAVSVGDYGTFAGIVSEVGTFPETEESLRAFLGTAHDVRALLASGPVVRVVIALDKIRWSKAAPPFELASQSDVKATITLAYEHPVRWLLS
ncbi:HlyD family efflux transporter periplasmic adaptor subunit [Amycolatopsis benzoatilytica]|uniref:HlyD family efflux transporter periplasmic adaptor subunit n=1 Tax=Amycolatopsis benzoatilytica TaxID=346045 RepID=UPI0003752096|nr:HlyD family efflux transporter periplasmic adaptor subunit [Amycolatopsis benzoatilytica]